MYIQSDMLFADNHNPQSLTGAYICLWKYSLQTTTVFNFKFYSRMDNDNPMEHMPVSNQLNVIKKDYVPLIADIKYHKL